MRGDSLRDLYAKALALLGLGLLGVAGALVDYWPVHGDMPYVASVLTHPKGLAALTADANASMPVVRSPASVRPADLAAPIAASDPAAAALVPVVDEHPLASSTTPAATSAASATDVASLDVAPASTSSLPVYTLNLIPPSASEEHDLLMAETPAAPVANTAQNGDNMFAGAAKSIGRASAKTGTTIASGFVSAATAIGRMFKK